MHRERKRKGGDEEKTEREAKNNKLVKCCKGLY